MTGEAAEPTTVFGLFLLLFGIGAVASSRRSNWVAMRK